MSASDLPELLPCPFCGEHFVEEAESDVPTIHGGNMRAVYCNGCFAEGPTADTPADAIAAWNTRAGDKRAREAAEDVAKAFWIAMQQSWQMIDPLRPPAPGSYWMGEHNGIAAALKTVRENFERELQKLAAAPTPGEKT